MEMNTDRCGMAIGCVVVLWLIVGSLIWASDRIAEKIQQQEVRR